MPPHCSPHTHRQMRCRTPCAAPGPPTSRTAGCRRRCCSRWAAPQPPPPLRHPAARRRARRPRRLRPRCQRGMKSCQGTKPGWKGLQGRAGEQGGAAGRLRRANRGMGLPHAAAAAPLQAPTCRLLQNFPCLLPPESAKEVSVSAADSSPLPPAAPSSFAAAAARCRSFFFFFFLPAPLLLPLLGGGVGTGSEVGGRGGRPSAAAAAPAYAGPPPSLESAAPPALSAAASAEAGVATTGCMLLPAARSCCTCACACACACAPAPAAAAASSAGWLAWEAAVFMLPAHSEPLDAAWGEPPLPPPLPPHGSLQASRPAPSLLLLGRLQLPAGCTLQSRRATGGP